MISVDLQQIIGRLNPHCRSTLEGSVGLTLSRTHYNVEIEHWLAKLIEAPDNDVAAILQQFAIEPGRLAADLTKVLDRLKTGNSRPPALPPRGKVVSATRIATLSAASAARDTVCEIAAGSA